MHRPAGHRSLLASPAIVAFIALAMVGCAASTATAPSAAPVASGSSIPSPAASAPEAFRLEPRTAAAMTWDPTSRAVVLFGGSGERGPLGDLAAWDGTRWSRLADDGPAPRDGALLVADPARGEVVLIGGRSGGTVHGDTWTWDGTAWTEADVPGPPARTHAVAAFDQASDRVLLYGGVGTDDVELRDTWAWDGSAWTLLDDVGIPGRAPNGMAFDSATGLPVLLAVDLAKPDANDAFPSSVWGWDGSAWNVLDDEGPAFSPVQSFVETAGHPQLLDGGVVTDTLSLYQWTGDDWSTVSSGGPPVRNGQAAAFD